MLLLDRHRLVRCAGILLSRGADPLPVSGQWTIRCAMDPTQDRASILALYRYGNSGAKPLRDRLTKDRVNQYKCWLNQSHGLLTGQTGCSPPECPTFDEVGFTSNSTCFAQQVRYFGFHHPCRDFLLITCQFFLFAYS